MNVVNRRILAPSAVAGRFQLYAFIMHDAGSREPDAIRDPLAAGTRNDNKVAVR